MDMIIMKIMWSLIAAAIFAGNFLGFSVVHKLECIHKICK